MPLFSDPLRYRRILFIALRSALVGSLKRRYTLFTAYVISGLVKVRYCKLPTRPQNSVAFTGSLSSRFVVDFIAMGVAKGVQSSIFAFDSKSCVYLV